MKNEGRSLTFAAVILEICAFLPDCLSGAVSEPGFSDLSHSVISIHKLITKTGVCPACILDFVRNGGQYWKSVEKDASVLSYGCVRTFDLDSRLGRSVWLISDSSEDPGSLNITKNSGTQVSSSAVIENSDIVSILSAPLSSPISFQKISFSESIPEYDGFYAVILDNVLSQAECEALVHAAEASTANGEWEVALVNVGGNQHLLRTDIRDCERIVWDDKTLVAAIFERVRPFVTELEKLENWPSVTGKESATKGEIWKLTRLNERMQYLKYSSGQYFRKHCDGVYETRSRDERSHFTLQIYLNDSASQAGNEALEGGSTRFHSMLEESLNLDVEPKTGRVLIFQHDLLHSGEEVFRGFKMTMRTDLMYKRA